MDTGVIVTKEIQLKDASRGTRQHGSGAHHGNRRQSRAQSGVETSQTDTRRGGPAMSRDHLDAQFRAGFAEVDRQFGNNQENEAA